DAHGGEVVDLEEAAVVDVLRGDAPEREAVRLLGEQRLQPVEAARVALLAVEVVQLLVERAASRGVLAQDALEAALDLLLAAAPLGEAAGIGLGARRQPRRRD